MNRRFSSRLAGALLLSASFAAPSMAITVTNFDFEALALPDSGIAIGIPSGWTVSGGVQGVYNPSAAFYGVAGISDPPNSGVIGTMSGPRVGFIFSSPGAHMTNTTGYSVVTGETYSLTVAVGARVGAGTVGAVVSLLDGDSELASLLVTTAPAAGSFGDVTLSYTATAADSGLLRIRLGQTGADNYADFDNVRLSAAGVATVPEPAHAWAFGLAGLAVLRRRRRAGATASSG